MPLYFMFCPHMLVGWLVVFFFHAKSVFKGHNCDESSLDLIASHCGFKNWVTFYFVLKWFHFGFIWFWLISAIFHCFWVLCEIHCGFGGSFEHQLVLIFWDFSVLYFLTWVRVLAWRVGAFTHSFISVFLLYLCLTEPIESAQGQYLCEAQ